AQCELPHASLPWGSRDGGICVALGLSLAYAIHRKGRPVSIRWALEPLFGDRVKGWLGDVIDTIAVLGTVFGIATSLGLGVQQISAGLVLLRVRETAGNTLSVILVVRLTLLANASADRR